jgi:hypothetical protein
MADGKRELVKGGCWPVDAVGRFIQDTREPLPGALFDILSHKVLNESPPLRQPQWWELLLLGEG